MWLFGGSDGLGRGEGVVGGDELIAAQPDHPSGARPGSPRDPEALKVDIAAGAKIGPVVAVNRHRRAPLRDSASSVIWVGQTSSGSSAAKTSAWVGAQRSVSVAAVSALDDARAASLEQARESAAD